jgi:hypothetical protein
MIRPLLRGTAANRQALSQEGVTPGADSLRKNRHNPLILLSRLCDSQSQNMGSIHVSAAIFSVTYNQIRPDSR